MRAIGSGPLRSACAAKVKRHCVKYCIGGSPITCPQCGGRGEVQRSQRSIFGQFVSIQPCPACHGEGTVVSDPCPECAGEGRTRSDRRIKVRIPAGVDTGNFLTLRGEGNAGPRGGPAGDLLVVIEVKPHERFVRQGDDVAFGLARDEQHAVRTDSHQSAAGHVRRKDGDRESGGRGEFSRHRSRTTTTTTSRFPTSSRKR